MVSINDILYLSFQDLQQYGYTETYLKKVCHDYRRGVSPAYANIPDPHDGRRKLVQYSTLPANAVAERNIPSEDQLRSQIAVTSLSQHVTDFAAANLRYDQALNYFKVNAKTFPHARELAQQAAWLLFLAATKPTAARGLGFVNVDALYDAALTEMATLGWQRWKVNSMQILRRKFRPFKALFKAPVNGDYTDAQYEQALDSLVHKGFGNRNREKLGQEQEACIFTLYANGDAKLTETQVYQFYTSIAGRKIAAGEWTTDSIVSLSTIKNFLYRPEIKQAYWKSRHGRQEYRRSFEIITHRNPANIANAMWVIDGTPWHRYYFENGKAYARLNVFVILDAHSWCVLGFFVSDHENTVAVTRSLRSACQLTGYVPHQIQYDNSSANLSYYATSCMQAIARYCTPTIVGNARSKVIEPFFKHFNSSVLRFRSGYTHSPVMANTLNGKPNPEALQKAVKGDLIPTSRDQAIRELHEDFAIWNHKPFRGSTSPLQKYQESISNSRDLQRPLTEQLLVDGFYYMPGVLKKAKAVDDNGKLRSIQQFVPQEYTYFNDGIEIVVDKKKHIFLTDDPQFNKQHLSRKFLVKYDPVELDGDGISKIYLYENTAEGMRPVIFNNAPASLANPRKFSQALIDRQPGEGAALHEHLQNKKIQEQEVDSLAQRYTHIAQATGTFMEIKPENAYPKEVLNAAKQQLTERLVNGESFTMVPNGHDEPEEVHVNPKHLDRWAD